MNVHSAPIGVFDSGLGGLSVAREIRRALPGERLLYVADSRYCPYGTRTPDEIAWRSLVIGRALVERGAKLLVVACNTATAVALETLRSSLPIPVIGLEPAVKPAIGLTKTGRIAVLATPRTATSLRLANLVDRYAGNTDVKIVPAPGWADLVEAGETDGPAAIAAVAPLIEPLVQSGVDTLVLGCTHYPFLAGSIRAVAGAGVELVDSGLAIARRTAVILSESDARTDEIAGGLEILTTGDPSVVRSIATRLLAEPVTVVRLNGSADDENYAPELVASPKLSAAWTASSSALA